MYADDTVVNKKGTNPSTLISCMNQSLFNNIIPWCEINRLTIHEKKTKTTIFNNSDNECPINIYYKQQPLEYVKTYDTQVSISVMISLWILM